MKSLRLGHDLTLPLEAVTRTFGVLAVRGAGKSNTAAVMAEEMFAAGLPFVVIDPVGSWYGLRSSAEGSSAGLPIPIFGGKHGDVPLERGGGEVVADLVVEKRLTCVLDLSRFDTESDKKAFLLAFARRLYVKNENPLHLFLEEADDYIPQKPMRDEAQLLRAWENIVRRGRARGLGMTLITQRSAAVNKMVLTQVETLFAMRTTGPQDIAAIEAWVKYHQAGAEVLSTLASLEDGEAWVWSPHFLRTMTRHQIRRRRTFDSGATPANVRATDRRPPATLADIDLSALQERMAATIEKAKAEDPRELRHEIDRLRRQLAATDRERRLASERQVSVQPLSDSDRALLDRVVVSSQMLTDGVHFDVDAMKAYVDRELDRFVIHVQDSLAHRRGELLAALSGADWPQVLARLSQITHPTTTATAPRSPLAGRVAPALAQATSRRPARRVSQPADPAVKGGKFKTLMTALAQAGQPLTDAQLAARAVMALSGTFDTYIGQMRQFGWIEGTRQALAITPAGLTALGHVDPLPTGADLRRHWLEQVSGGKERALLEQLFDAYPDALTAADLARRADMALSGTFDTYIGHLRRLLLVEGPRSALRANPELFR